MSRETYVFYDEYACAGGSSVIHNTATIKSKFFEVSKEEI